MSATFNEVIDILDKWQFFYGQIAVRELWMDKPKEIQEEDLVNFNRDLETVRSFVDLYFNDTPRRSCTQCKYLQIINNSRLYAKCDRTGFSFEPFMTDTRQFFCACFEKGADNGEVDINESEKKAAMTDDLTDDFLKDVVKTLDKAVERLLHPYEITKDNAHEFKDRVESVMDCDCKYTRRAYFLDGKYIGTVRSHVNTDFEDLHAEFVVEIIYEDKVR